MSNIIKVENLSKKYRILHAKKGAKYSTLRDEMTNIFKKPLQYLTGKRIEKDSIWALKNINLEIKEGEILGIIGPNGAGKTTLLKILSRIVSPTEGRAVIKGRVGSLLEVGTGFHPELTGRENIYLNGAILGMSKKEIERKFNQIVDFAGVEKFLDVPAKRYSSGMFVRLAFSVAAHLEPDILLVDEVLAVGDAEFQKKSLGRMKEITKNAQRTILFVSHNMTAIRQLCQRTILIENGHILMDGNSEAVIKAYLSRKQNQASTVRFYNNDEAPGDENVRLKAVKLINYTDNSAKLFNIDQDILVEIEYIILRPTPNFHIYIQVFTQDGILVFGSADWDDLNSGISQSLSGHYVARCIIPANLLNWGEYSLTVKGMVPGINYLFEEDNILRWEINKIGGAGFTGSVNRPGILRPKLKWDIKKKN